MKSIIIFIFTALFACAVPSSASSVADVIANKIYDAERPVHMSVAFKNTWDDSLSELPNVIGNDQMEIQSSPTLVDNPQDNQIEEAPLDSTVEQTNDSAMTPSKPNGQPSQDITQTNPTKPANPTQENPTPTTPSTPAESQETPAPNPNPNQNPNPTTNQTPTEPSMPETEQSTQPSTTPTEPSNKPTIEPDEDVNWKEEENPIPSDVNQPKPKCDAHDMRLVETKVTASYELYNYVTKYYKCANCDHTANETAKAASDLTSSQIRSAEKTLINKVNNARSAAGLDTLWTNSEWNSWAQTRAKELATKYSHTRPNGKSWAHNDGSYYTIAENIAAGDSSANSFFNSFIGSNSHKVNILSSDAVGIGVGIYVAEDGSTYCAMVFVAAY